MNRGTVNRKMSFAGEPLVIEELIQITALSSE